MIGHGMYGWGWGWGFPIALIGMAVFWAAVVLIIVALVRGLGRSRHQPGQPGWPGTVHGAEQMLAERFARGEIDEEEYRSRPGALRAP